MLCIVQGTVHAGLGTWLKRSQGLPVVEAFQEAHSGHEPRWPCHPSAIIRLGKMTTSVGSLILALLVHPFLAIAILIFLMMN